VNGRDYYREARDAFVDVLGSVDALTLVPACPAWSVHDLVAHQVHQLEGACDGTFPVVDAIAALGSPDPAERRAAAFRQERWIDLGVRALEAHDVPRLVEDWARLANDAPDAVLVALLPDVAVHLFDLLGAVGSPSHRDHPLVFEALTFWAGYSDARVRLAGYAGLRLDLDDESCIGDSSAAVVVPGDAFELLRVITGRRSRGQVAALKRAGPNPNAIDAMSVYGWRDAPLRE
jgi:hypothetical protein